MATKRTDTKSKKATAKKAPAKKTAVKKAPKEKVEAKPVGPRHPKGRVIALNGDKAEGAKEALASQLASALATESQDKDTVETKLKTASNAQLLRLQRVVQTVKDKWGSRDKLIAALGEATKHGKDKDYLAKLATFSLPQLVDMAQSQQRRSS